MNERIRKIISILLKNPTIKSSELANKLSLTKRQVNYAITQFNQEKMSGIDVLKEECMDLRMIDSMNLII